MTGSEEFVFPHEKLRVWGDARDFAVKVYQATARFPRAERFSIVDQLRRAAVSVASNIAEGAARTNPKDQAHFTQIAYSSLMEVDCQFQIAANLDYLDGDLQDELRAATTSLARQLNALRKAQLNRS